MSEARSGWLRRAAIVYLCVTIPLALIAGLIRTVILLIQTNHPARYLFDTASANAGIAFLPGLALLPVFLAACTAFRLSHRLAPNAAGAYGALLGVFPGFWLLTTPIGFWEPVFADPLSLIKQTGFWGAVFFVVGAVVRTFISVASFGRSVRRSLLAAALLLAILGLLRIVPYLDPSSGAHPLAERPSARNRPNIFLVLVDTLRPDHLSVYGYDLPTSPEVDAFARESVLYERSFSQAPWTRPSCASLLSGLYPPEVGTRKLWDALPSEVPILPQYLKVEGYATAGIISSVQVSPVFGFDKGFDLMDIGNTRLKWAGLTIPKVRLGLSKRSTTYPRYNAEQLTKRAIEWIEANREKGRPLFMYLHYADPHAPYRPPGEGDRWRRFARGEGRLIPTPRDAPPMDGTPLSKAEADALVAQYDAEVAYFDRHFGRLVRHLKETGLFEGALVVFTSDHGEEFGEHDGWEHGHTLYNELLHVPLIVKFPAGAGPEPGSCEERMVGLVDVAPTIRDLLGAEWDVAGWRGRSLLDPDLGRTVYAANGSPALRALFAGVGKLIQEYGPNDELLHERFYRLDRDLGEQAGEAPGASGDSLMLEMMRRIIREVEAAALPSVKVDVSPETRDELKALGYVE